MSEEVKGSRILIVDDEPDIVSYLETILEDHGFDTLSTGNGADGVEIAKTQRPDLITLDITMPGMSGTEVFRHLRTDPETRGIPVLIITGVMDFRQFISQRSLEPPEGYLEKPIEPGLLMTTVHRILGQKK